MPFGSVCSGIEAASIAFAPLGWRAAASAISRGSGQLTKPAASASQAMATSLLFFRRDVLIQQSPHPLRPPKL